MCPPVIAYHCRGARSIQGPRGDRRGDLTYPKLEHTQQGVVIEQ